MKLPRLYAILDTFAYEARGFPVIEAAEVLLAGGLRMLQYRHKGQFTEERFEEARRIAEACRAGNAIFIMNDRADYAQLLHCGVHVGQDDLPAAEARKIAGVDAVVGLSTHNRRQLEQADGLPVDYVALGPVFPTASKAKPDPVVGISEIARLGALLSMPLVAIGGIGLESALRVIDSGADAVAVISGLLPERDGDLKGLAALTEQWLAAVDARSPAL